MVLSSGVAVEYDWLVLALGADSVFFGIEGVKEHCVPFCTYSDAMKVPFLFALSSKAAEHKAVPAACLASCFACFASHSCASGLFLHAAEGLVGIV